MKRPCSILLAVLVVLAGCGTIASRSPDGERRPSGSVREGGGYYKDDGPGDDAPANLAAVPDAMPKAERLVRAANRPYEVFGKRYVPLTSLAPFRQRGVASWYGRRYHGQPTSIGERYNMYAMSAAHPTLPLPSYARVTNLANGRSVVVRVNDRGPFLHERVIDLSYTAAFKLGYVQAGRADVEVEALLPGMAAAAPEPQNATAPPVVSAALPPASQPSSSAPAAVFLQLGAFSALEGAESFRARVYRQLSWLNDVIQVYPVANLFKLHLGPYRSRDDASRVAARIQAELNFAPLVVVR